MPLSPTSSVNPSDLGEGTSNTDEALYHRGLDHLQAGEWEAAVGCFSVLAERCPEQELYASLLKQTRLKARLGDDPPQRRQYHSALRSRRVWAILLVNLALWLAIFGQKLYEDHIVPSLKQRQVALQRQTLLSEGRQLLIVGNLEEARGRYVEVLALSPDNVAARAALQEINRRRQLAQSYETALALIEQEEWDSALAALEAIRQDDPSFRDVQDQIERLHKTREQATAFHQANQFLRSGDVQRATEQILLLREIAPDYKPEAVNKLLVESYMKQAEAALSEVVQGTTRDIDQLQTAIGDLSELVRGAATEIEQLKEAIKFLAKALEIDPTDPYAVRENELAQEYLAGLEAYRSGSWELAAMHLANIYPMAPEYSNGRAAELLQASFVQSGSRYIENGDFERAADRYRQAIALGLVGDGRPMPNWAETLLETADGLIRQHRYEEAVVVFGDILIIMNFPVAASTKDEPKIDEFQDEELLAQRSALARRGEPDSEEAESDEIAPAQDAAASAESTATPSVELYVVRPNDTLGDIARRFNTTVSTLLAANDIIRDPNLIRPRWRLFIPQP